MKRLKTVPLIIVVLIVFLLMGCVSSEQQTSVTEKQMFVMGTVVNIRIYGETDEKSQMAFQALQARFETQQVEWSPKKNGALKRLNTAFSNQESQVVDADLLAMITLATQLSEQSQGMFNPAIGQLINLWGFADELGQGPPPESSVVSDMVKLNPQMWDMTVNGHTLQSNNSALSLNLGAFAKGYAVDKAIEYLISIDVNNAIVNAGGDLRAIGRKGSLPWTIGIRHPREDGVIASVEIQQDESLFTSGDYERYYDFQGQRYHHILDPQTGHPANQVTSVTVLHDNAAVADATATALFVAGPENWATIAALMGVSHVMLIDKTGQVHLTDKMEKRLTFIDKASLKVKVIVARD